MSKIVTLNNLKREPTVRVAIPHYGALPPEMLKPLLFLMRQGIPGYKVDFRNKQTALLPVSRSRLAERDTSYDYLMFVDADMGFGEPYDMVETESKRMVPTIVMGIKRLLDHGLDVVGGLYMKRQMPHDPLAYIESPRVENFYDTLLEYPDDQVIEVDAVGTGFLCIHRRVIEAVEEYMEQQCDLNDRMQWLLSMHKEEMVQALPEQHQESMREALGSARVPFGLPFWMDAFRNSATGKIEPQGEDIFFCKLAKKLGFKIHLDTGCNIGHMTTKFVTKDVYEQCFREGLIEGRKQLLELDKQAPILCAPEVANG